MSEQVEHFQWTGLDKQAKRISGVIQASDMKEAQHQLKMRNIEIISIDKKSGFRFGVKKKKIKRKDIILFTRYLSTMMSAGLPIMQALDIIGKDQENPALSEMVIAIRNNVAGGKTLSESFSQYPNYFSQLYCNLVKAGEKSGTLEKILKRLGDYIERTESLKRKIKKALVYPAAIVTVAFAVSLILLIFVVPSFEKIFSSFGAQLPLFTRGVISVSHALKSYWWIMILSIFLIVYYFRYLLKTSKKTHLLLDRWSLKIFVLGTILKKGIIARYTRTLAITLEAGMPIVESMKSMSELMGNSIYQKGIEKISDDLISGNQLSVAMANTHLFPNMVTQMISIGEASGSLTDMLNKVADYYEEEVNTVVDNLSNLLEPLIMVLLGSIVGTFVIAMYLPIFKMGSLF